MNIEKIGQNTGEALTPEEIALRREVGKNAADAMNRAEGMQEVERLDQVMEKLKEEIVALQDAVRYNGLTAERERDLKDAQGEYESTMRRRSELYADLVESEQRAERAQSVQGMMRGEQKASEAGPAEAQAGDVDLAAEAALRAAAEGAEVEMPAEEVSQAIEVTTQDVDVVPSTAEATEFADFSPAWDFEAAEADIYDPGMATSKQVQQADLERAASVLRSHPEMWTMFSNLAGQESANTQEQTETEEQEERELSRAERLDAQAEVIRKKIALLEAETQTGAIDWTQEINSLNLELKDIANQQEMLEKGIAQQEQESTAEAGEQELSPEKRKGLVEKLSRKLGSREGFRETVRRAWQRFVAAAAVALTLVGVGQSTVQAVTIADSGIATTKDNTDGYSGEADDVSKGLDGVNGKVGGNEQGQSQEKESADYDGIYDMLTEMGLENIDWSKGSELELQGYDLAEIGGRIYDGFMERDGSIQAPNGVVANYTEYNSPDKIKRNAFGLDASETLEGKIWQKNVIDSMLAIYRDEPQALASFIAAYPSLMSGVGMDDSITKIEDIEQRAQSILQLMLDENGADWQKKMMAAASLSLVKGQVDMEKYIANGPQRTFYASRLNENGDVTGVNSLGLAMSVEDRKDAKQVRVTITFADGHMEQAVFNANCGWQFSEDKKQMIRRSVAQAMAKFDQTGELGTIQAIGVGELNDIGTGEIVDGGKDLPDFNPGKEPEILHPTDHRPKEEEKVTVTVPEWGPSEDEKKPEDVKPETPETPEEKPEAPAEKPEVPETPEEKPEVPVTPPETPETPPEEKPSESDKIAEKDPDAGKEVFDKNEGDASGAPTVTEDVKDTGVGETTAPEFTEDNADKKQDAALGDASGEAADKEANEGQLEAVTDPDAVADIVESILGSM